MKTKIGILVSLLIGSVLASVVLAAAQQPQRPHPPEAQMQPQPPPQMRPQPPQGQMQPQPPQPPQPPTDPLADVIFPPEMIMIHTRELGLTDDQKSFMRGEIKKTTTRFNELQWQLQDAMEALHETMQSSLVNEQQALAQLNRVLETEREIKTLHITMAIRLKNKLTPEQQERLQMMRTGRP